MESTTLSFPSPGPSLAVIARVSGQPLSTIIATDAGQDEVPSTVLSEGFTLYIPYSTQDRVVVTNTAAILSALATGTSKEILMYSNNNPIPTAETEVSLDAGSTLHVPYTAALPSMVTIANLADILTEAVRAQVSATNPASESVEQSNANASPSTINDDGSASSPSDSPGGVATSATSATAGRGEGSSTEGSSASNSADNASASISSTDGSSPIDSLQPNGVPNSTFGGALAGGILGGFIFGLLVGFVALWCIRRRRSRTTAVRNASRRKSVPKEKADFALTNASGWQKHLPQDRGDEAIVKALNNVFGQVQIYVDGFYEAKPGKPSSNAVTAVEQLSSDGFATVLRRADNALPVLEGVLMRWIIHRISLRSEAGESFLPPEYTLIPLINRWHMESDGSEKLAPEHLRKGVFQASSQWRVLTAFLYSSQRADKDFRRTQEAKINQASAAFTEAFAPWAISTTSTTNRKESLRKILFLARDVGFVLFAQSSTYKFDWSDCGQGYDKSVVVTPALLKTSDESAEPLRAAQQLLPARSAAITNPL